MKTNLSNPFDSELEWCTILSIGRRVSLHQIKTILLEPFNSEAHARVVQNIMYKKASIITPDQKHSIWPFWLRRPTRVLHTKVQAILLDPLTEKAKLRVVENNMHMRASIITPDQNFSLGTFWIRRLSKRTAKYYIKEDQYPYTRAKTLSRKLLTQQAMLRVVKKSKPFTIGPLRLRKPS